MDQPGTLRQSLRSGALLWGPFMTAGSVPMAEATARIDCDMVCVDMEHGVFDAPGLSATLLGLRAAATPSVVRVASNTPSLIGQALDLGADAVLCPHIRDAADARALASAARYALGRGFSGGTRAAGYGSRSLAEHCRAEDGRIAVMAQIEDGEAVGHAEAICAVDGIDLVFIGRSDLTVSLGHRDRNHPDVLAAVERVARIAVDAGKSVGTFTTDLSEIPRWRALGIDLFLLSSDVGLMVAGGQALDQKVRNADG